MCKKIQRLMIIELRKYNSAAELLIESNSAGLPGRVSYRSGSRKVSVTTVAVRMKEMGDGARGKRPECIQ